MYFEQTDGQSSDLTSKNVSESKIPVGSAILKWIAELVNFGSSEHVDTADGLPSAGTPPLWSKPFTNHLSRSQSKSVNRATNTDTDSELLKENHPHVAGASRITPVTQPDNLIFGTRSMTAARGGHWSHQPPLTKAMFNRHLNEHDQLPIDKTGMDLCTGHDFFAYLSSYSSDPDNHTPRKK